MVQVTFFDGIPHFNTSTGSSSLKYILTGVFILLQIFRKLFSAQGSPSPGSLLNLSLRFLFILVVFMTYLFVFDDSLTS